MHDFCLSAVGLLEQPPRLTKLSCVNKFDLKFFRVVFVLICAFPLLVEI